MTTRFWVYSPAALLLLTVVSNTSGMGVVRFAITVMIPDDGRNETWLVAPSVNSMLGRGSLNRTVASREHRMVELELVTFAF
ncbi:hypothetical protein NUF46_004304 [Yersinia enterocolitica]|uniref:hypothetical protein n=1 Tax=Yersinia enterocolitica TaxID=630 RepID=UPI0032F3C2CB|nr:hypothetical protein [Yersinia enterocolitica]